jgi:hypothetical protein
VELVFLTCLIVVGYECELTSIMEFVQVHIAGVLLCRLPLQAPVRGMPT